VKASEWKSIHCKNVAAVLTEPTLKFQEGCAVSQFVGGAIAQAQANRVRLFRADAFADAKGIILERLESFRPRLTAVNIRAIRQMQSRLEFHPVD
jgi:hypothetical protein